MLKHGLLLEDVCSQATACPDGLHCPWATGMGEGVLHLCPIPREVS